MPIIDAQVHCYEVESEQWPRGKKKVSTPLHVTGDEQVAALDALGVDGAILVSSFAVYGYDTRYVTHVQRAHPGRFGIVRPVDARNPESPEVVAEWKKTPGAVAVRVMFAKDTGNDPNAPGIHDILKAAARHDMPVNVQCGGNLEVGTALVDAHPQTRFIMDHVGMHQPRVKPAPSDVWDKLPLLLEMGKRPNVALKLTGICTMSQKGHPYDDLWDPLARIFDAWGMDRCLWGTDWTRTSKLLPHSHGVELFKNTTRLSESDKAKVMGGNAVKWYQWEPSGTPRK